MTAVRAAVKRALDASSTNSSSGSIPDLTGNQAEGLHDWIVSHPSAQYRPGSLEGLVRPGIGWWRLDSKSSLLAEVAADDSIFLAFYFLEGFPSEG